MKEFPRRFLSLRDKTGVHRRSKSVPPSDPRAPLSNAENLHAVFKAGHSTEHVDESNETTDDAPKIADIQRRLDELGITNVTAEHIRDIMATKFANGDPGRTAAFIDIEHKSAAGILTSYNPSVHLVGAENRGAVTCYLDSLLFAMFAKLDAFECMLKNEFPPEDPRSTLVNLLRIWVNMLRTGRLIRSDLTKLIQDALADCGWSDARRLEQQDTSEAFAFLTETLQLPLLSLQVDLFHQGKKDDDDHKVVYERLLNLAVPPDPTGKGIKLEDCLEDYFNTQVDVMRDSEEARKSVAENQGNDRKTSTSVRWNTNRPVNEEQGEPSTTMTAEPVAAAHPPSARISSDLPEDGLSPSPTNSAVPNREDSVIASAGVDMGIPNAQTSEHIPDRTDESATNGEAALHISADDEDKANSQTGAERRPSIRNRSTSIIQHVVVEERGQSSSIGSSSMSQHRTRKGSTIVKAVTIPAWQFFRLIPWHALTSNDPKNNMDVAMNFDQKPVVGICLKRYAMTATGTPKRHNTFIDIPDSLRLPHFMLADGSSDEEPDKLNMDYNGHYISFARVAPKLLTSNRRHDFDPPPDYEEAQWVQFDDLQTGRRVTYVDDIRRAFRQEMPYLLFYQVMPMYEEASCPSVEGVEEKPPSYSESKSSMEILPSPSAQDANSMGSPGHDSHSENQAAVEMGPSLQSKPPSIRLSIEVERHPGKASEWSTSGYQFQPVSLADDSRRGSLYATDSEVLTPAATPGSHSPVITPGDDSNAGRLSRAASRFTRGRPSRPSSQSGEGRISFSMNRLSGFMKSSRDQLIEPVPSSTSLGTPGLATSMEVEGSGAPGEIDSLQSEGHLTPTKQKHKGGKARDKGKNKDKDKARKAGIDSQPDRECVVM